MVVTFTLLTVGCAYLLSKDPQYFTWARVLDGLSFHPPQGGMSTAVTVFGATGVGAIELIAYPYWCIEKGYARFTGIREKSQEWKARAEGWIKVMGTDVLSACVIYTFATVAFYFLGAGVLSGMGLVPKGLDMVRTLSHMFTQTLGNWSFYLFLIGSMAVLYSTVFSGIAALSRMLADFAGMLGLYPKDDYAARLRVIRLLVVGLPLIPTLLFLYVQEPVVMIKVSGISQALLLPGIGFAILYLGKTYLPPEIAPKNWITAALWGSTLVMAFLMGYSVVLAVLRW
ncbi:MAG: divalent metal cation transporter, partial [Acidobacteriota bacterium]|nr:divalent metal cation transporter [Acidobacteriota bacterium]